MPSNVLSYNMSLQKQPKVCRKPAKTPIVIIPWPPTQYHVVCELTHYPAAGGPVFRRRTGKLIEIIPTVRWNIVWNEGPQQTKLTLRLNVGAYRVNIRVDALHNNGYIGGGRWFDIHTPATKPFDTGPLTMQQDGYHTYTFVRVTE